MAKPRKIHTLESIYAQTDEVGDCRIWNGYYTNNGVPMIYSNGRMEAVRKLVLSFVQPNVKAQYYGCKCGNPKCVAAEHVQPRTQKQHKNAMIKKSALTAASPVRRAKISATKLSQGKLNAQALEQIRLSEKSGPELSREYGVTRSRINQIKRGGSVFVGNVWAGLM